MMVKKKTGIGSHPMSTSPARGHHFRSYRPVELTENSAVAEERLYLCDIDPEDDVMPGLRDRSAALLVSDFLLLLVWDHLCYLALLVEMALRWPWPYLWLETTRWFLISVLDIFGLLRSLVGVPYIREGYTPSHGLVFPFWSQCILWAVLLFVLLTVMVIARGVISSQRKARMLIQLATLRRVITIMIQILALPLGVTIGKVFHCSPVDSMTTTNTGNAPQTYLDYPTAHKWHMDVDNSVLCFSTEGGTHWAYLLVACLVGIVGFSLFPVYVITKTASQTVNLSSTRHEAYLKLKEAEYERGLDALWKVDDFPLFSSFRRPAVYFRAGVHLAKLIAVVLYAVLFNHVVVQAAMFAVFFMMQAVVYSCLRPFRVSCYTVVLVLSHLGLGFSALLGALVATYPVTQTPTALLTPRYSLWILVIAQVAWLVGIGVCLILICVRGPHRVSRHPLWPTLSPDALSTMGKKNRRYILATLRAKAAIEHCLSVPALFSPVHELSRHILIINAIFREADFNSDPLQERLWNVMNELVSVHSRLAQRSIYAQSVKPSVRATATRLENLLPSLAHRLHQREFDLVFASPKKRRILLKMYAVSVFSRCLEAKRKKETQQQPRVARLWAPPSEKEDQEKDVYYPELYPTKEEGPNILQYKPSAGVKNLASLRNWTVPVEPPTSSVVNLLNASQAESENENDASQRDDRGVENRAFMQEDVEGEEGHQEPQGEPQEKVENSLD